MFTSPIPEDSQAFVFPAAVGFCVALQEVAVARHPETPLLLAFVLPVPGLIEKN